MSKGSGMKGYVERSRALYLLEPGKLAIAEREIGKKMDQYSVMVRMLSASICETDIKIYKGEVRARRLPIVPGHEGVGEVVYKGSKVKNLELGDRVVVDPNVYDGTCELCRSGKTNLCPNGGLLGRDYDGVFGEYIVLPEGNLYKIPAAIDIETAPLIQPLSTVVHAQELVSIKPGDTVAIIGLGATGLMHAQVAKAKGAFVIGLGRDPFKLRLAKDLGVDEVIPLDLGSRDEILRLTNGKGVDLAIESVGFPHTFELAFNIVKAGGKILMFGITAQDLRIGGYDLYYKEVSIIGARSSVQSDFLRAIKLVELGKVKLKPLITQIIRFENAAEAFEKAGRSERGRIRTVMLFD